MKLVVYLKSNEGYALLFLRQVTGFRLVEGMSIEITTGNEFSN
jgi:hypothetical protein